MENKEIKWAFPVKDTYCAPITVQLESLSKIWDLNTLNPYTYITINFM